IVGNARGGDFAFYRLVYGRGMSPTEWGQIGPDHDNQVEQNVLENFDTTGLDDGLYTLQLQIVEHNQNVRQAAIQLTVDNTPPAVDLTYPPEGQEYEYGFDEWVNINAEVKDNYAINRVEFYQGNWPEETEAVVVPEGVDPASVPPQPQPTPFAVRSVAPFNVNWTLQGPGSYSFYVKVFDAAGNEVRTEPVEIFVVARARPD
ncbi:MAG: hypothetical protein RBT47_01345, partial [Anaerolineae bacterium]|nr:hypothetical protein [Anaerolineae bacterium]